MRASVLMQKSTRAIHSVKLKEGSDGQGSSAFRRWLVLGVANKIEGGIGKMSGPENGICSTLGQRSLLLRVGATLELLCDNLIVF